MKLIALILALAFAQAVGAQQITRPFNGGTGVSQANTKTITLGGPLITSGAFTTTITSTATTDATLPAGTTTLLNTTGSGSGLTAVNAVTLGGATFAAPGAIGGGTPAAGAFTTLNASGVVTLTGTTDSTSIITGNIINPGGQAVAKALWVGGLANIAGAVTLGGAIVGPATATVFNTVSTTVNAFGASTNTRIGGAAGMIGLGVAALSNVSVYAQSTRTGLTVSHTAAQFDNTVTYSSAVATSIGVAGVIRIGDGSAINTDANSGVIGVSGTVLNSNTAAVTNTFGLRATIQNLAAGTITNAVGAQVIAVVNSGGGVITNLYGFRVAPQTVGTTLNVSFAGEIASGTGRWNAYMSGTADNAFAGNTRIGSTVAPTVALDVTGAALVSTTLGVTGGAALGGTAVNYYKHRIGITFTSGGASSVASGIAVDGTVTGVAGDTSHLSGMNFAPSGIVTQGNSDTIGIVTSVLFQEPIITVGTGDTITVASTVYIASAPTEGATNAALYIASGSLNALGAVLLPGLATGSAATVGTLCQTVTTGNITVNTTLACLASSEKFKQNIRPLDIGLNTVMALRPISYELKPEFNPTGLKEMVGLSAEQVATVDERLVGMDPDGKTPQGVRYMQMTALLVKAIQEQQGQIDILARKFQAIGGQQYTENK